MDAICQLQNGVDMGAAGNVGAATNGGAERGRVALYLAVVRALVTGLADPEVP